MYYTYLYNQSQWSILNLFCTDKKKSKVVLPVQPQTSGGKHKIFKQKENKLWKYLF